MRSLNELSADELAAIRNKYLGGGWSLRKLAAEEKVSFHALAKLAKREDWAAVPGKAKEELSKAMALETRKVAKRVVMDAAGLETRTMTTVEKFLDRVDEHLKTGKDLSAAQLRDLAGVLRTSSELGRTTLRMDEEAKSKPMINLETMRVLVEYSESPTPGPGHGLVIDVETVQDQAVPLPPSDPTPTQTDDSAGLVDPPLAGESNPPPENAA